jgi:hypothetical protein
MRAFNHSNKNKAIPLLQCRRQGGEEYRAYSFLTRLDAGKWSASRPGCALPPGKEPQYPLDRRLGGPQSWSWHRGLEKKCYASTRDQNPVVQSVVRHYTEWLNYSSVKNSSGLYNTPSSEFEHRLFPQNNNITKQNKTVFFSNSITSFLMKTPNKFGA